MFSTNYTCRCVACKETFESVEKINLCLPCFDAYLANLENK